MAKEKKVHAAKKSESFLQSKSFKSFMAKLYGWGASIVIVGALFKIQHWKGAGMMLTLGLSTEALIFFISAFDKQKEFHWEKVYPELLKEDEHAEGGAAEEKKSISDEITKMLEEAKIEQATVNRLGTGLNKLSDAVDGMKDISNAALATNEYTSKVRVAAENVGKASDSYERAAESMSQLSEASAGSKQYAEQIQSATQHLVTLNSVYELELTETGKRKDVMARYNENLSSMLDNLLEAGSVSATLKENFGKLNSNIAALNNIYGNMLNAMTMK